jgi:hypothetical protein
MSDIARWSWNIVSISDANGAYVSVDDHRVEVERLTAERDAALAEVERLIAERDTAQANVKWLIDRGNGKASLHRSRATDEDIWREAFMALCGQSLKEGYMIRAESADAALAVYRKRWPR